MGDPCDIWAALVSTQKAFVPDGVASDITYGLLKRMIFGAVTVERSGANPHG
jgi:hypothetical protein